MDKELINYLGSCVTEKRLELFRKVLENRTDYITLVLEDLYQPHNASAVLRTADCFGVQDIHIIENRNKYEVNPDVALGSSKWLNLHKHNKNENNTEETINNLRSKGYRIVATTPHTNDVNLHDFDVTKGKFALLFGTEMSGLSDIAINNSDEFLRIPMFGFTESFNISVSAAIILNELITKMHLEVKNWKISENRSDEILFEWLKASIKKSDKIIEEFLKRNR